MSSSLLLVALCVMAPARRCLYSDVADVTSRSFEWRNFIGHSAAKNSNSWFSFRVSVVLLSHVKMTSFDMMKCQIWNWCSNFWPQTRLDISVQVFDFGWISYFFQLCTPVHTEAGKNLPDGCALRDASGCIFPPTISLRKLVFRGRDRFQDLVDVVRSL